MTFKIQTKSFDELTSQQLYEIISLRIKVFCVEQECPYQDVDGEDYKAMHLFIEDQKKIIAYARILNPEQSSCYIGRVVVDPKYRYKGLANKLMKVGVEYCLCKIPEADILISAQSYLREFYQSLGFKSLDEYYLEDDIPHEKMQYKG